MASSWPTSCSTKPASTRGADGVRFEIVHDVTPYGEEWRRFGEYTQQQLAKIGIKATLRVEDVPGWLRRVYTNYDFQLTNNWIQTLADPSIGVHRLYHSGSIKPGTVFVNNSRWSTKETDELMDKANVELDPKKRAALYHELQKRVVEASPLVLRARAGLRDRLQQEGATTSRSARWGCTRRWTRSGWPSNAAPVQRRPTSGTADARMALRQSLAYALRRLAQAVPTVLVIVGAELPPAAAGAGRCGRRAGGRGRLGHAGVHGSSCARRFGLDQPLGDAAAALHQAASLGLDLGFSFRHNMPVRRADRRRGWGRRCC